VGTAGSTCTQANTEFRNGDPNASWAGNPTNAHTFATAGVFHYICEVHGASGMTGTITVGTSTGTGTTNTETITDTTTTPTQTTPSGTTPTQTTLTQATPAPDTTAPSFTGKLRRKASRKLLLIQLGSSEDATLTATVFRRPPRGHTFARVGQASLAVKAGRNTVSLPRKARGAMRSGAYRVKLFLEDGAGNRSGTRALVFKIAP
jgi:hypothetical protein